MSKRALLIAVGVIAGGAFLSCLACLGIGLIGASSPSYQATAAAREVAEATDAVRPTATRASAAAAPAEVVPSPTTASTAAPRAPAGTSRSSPAPLGQPIVADDDVQVTVLSVTRGADAWAEIHASNMFNSEPDAGMEYVLVELRAAYLGEADETRTVSEMDFRVVGEDGAIYDAAIFTVLERSITSELFGGGSTVGEVAFQVRKGEQELVLIYDSGVRTKAYYCALTP